MFTFTDALIIACEAHREAKDGGGVDYIKHPLHIYHQIKMKGGSNEAQMVAILHDVIEDSYVTIKSLEEKGCPESVIKALQLLTHVRDEEWVTQRKNEYISQNMDTKYALIRAKDDEYFKYVKKLSKNDIARSVKIEDLRHNSDIRRSPEDVYENQYLWNRMAKYAHAFNILTGGKVGYC